MQILYTELLDKPQHTEAETDFQFMFPEEPEGDTEFLGVLNQVVHYKTEEDHQVPENKDMDHRFNFIFKINGATLTTDFNLSE